MTKAEAEALAAIINATPGYEAAYRAAAGYLVVKAHNQASGGCTTFTVRSQEGWERKRTITVFQPVLLPAARAEEA